MNLNSPAMERLRSDLIRQAHMERQGDSNGSNVDVEGQPDMQESRSNNPFSRLFRRGQPQSTNAQPQLAEIESIKSQDSNPNQTNRHSRVLSVPNFLRIWGNNNSSLTNETRNTTTSPAPLLPLTQPSELSSPTRPDPVATPSAESRQARRERRERRERRDHMDPIEAQLAEILGGSVVDRRRRRRHHHDRSRSRHRSRRNNTRRHPKHFMFCLPWIRSRRMRAQILRCFASGLFLIILVTVYLTLSMTHKVNTREMTIMLIMVILFATIFFFHGLVRLCILVIKSNREAAMRANRPPRYRGPPRYAVPPVPIPVVLARDEEAVGIESEVTKCQPPAYGRWRETVRVDPDRLFWQRNEDVDLSQLRPGAQSGPRPPSYVSEDGISYVVEAAPRSTAPTTDVPLPPHPSEVGRVARMPTA
ncbi:hypothetical protein CEP52_000460 [Fusarium oligoseptatum]|uniref:Uncharacterized protein n=1 Tax=Fusarium oligoseptatum TaxID=2604345 RepID=A0A428UNV4_9HYPO|nr:hypothetical protein CEP52_000460 [Fusarium oligoseptatum]